MTDATVSDHVMSGLDEARLRAALEIEVTRLIDELNSARQLHRISTELLSERRPEALSEQILEAMISVMRSQAASMQMLEPHTGILRLFAWRGFDAASAVFWSSVDASSASSCGKALRTGQRILVRDIEACEFMAGTEDLESYRRSRLRAVQSTPLMSRTGCAIGMVSTHWREPHEPSEDDFSRFEVLTRQAADLIERAQTEAALRESEERFRQFAAHSTDVLWIVDVETSRIEYLSPAYEQLWGRLPSATRYLEDWLKTVHSDDRELAEKAYERVRAGEVVVQEYRIVRPDGAVRTLRGTRFPMPDEHGRITRIGGIAQDVTKHGVLLVYVVDATPASRESLAKLLQAAGYEVQTFASAQSFLRLVPALVLGCVVVDITNAEAADLMIPKELKSRRDSMPVVILGTSRGDVELAVQAMKAGAVDYIELPYRPERLLSAVATALAEIRDRAERDRSLDLARGRIADLSGREREILERMLAGANSKSIARNMGISPRIFEVHRARILDRLGVRSVTEAALIATAAGLKPRRDKEDGDVHKWRLGAHLRTVSG